MDADEAIEISRTIRKALVQAGFQFQKTIKHKDNTGQKMDFYKKP